MIVLMVFLSALVVFLYVAYSKVYNRLEKAGAEVRFWAKQSLYWQKEAQLMEQQMFHFLSKKAGAANDEGA